MKGVSDLVSRNARSQVTYPEATERPEDNLMTRGESHSLAIGEYKRNRTRLGNHASLILGSGSNIGTLGILDMSRPKELLPAKLANPGLNGLYRGEARISHHGY